MGNSILETNNLTIGYKINSGETKIVHRNINLSLRSGEITTLLGVNGAGKSTLIRALCGFLKPLAGKITIMGKSLDRYTKEELSTIVSVVLTERVNDGGLTVFEVISLGRYPYTGFFGRLTQEDKDIVEQSLKDVGVWEFRDRYISELSDGERQKVMIAKSLAQQSKIIILDEPTSFLDIRSRMEIISLLRQLSKNKGMTFLLSLHDLWLSLQYSDNLWILSKDDGIFCGQTEEMILSGAINKAVDSSGKLVFNPLNGIFTQNEDFYNRLCYEGEDLVWVKNAISRAGYICSENIEDITVSVKSYEDIIVKHDGKQYNCRSIAEMLKYI